MLKGLLMLLLSKKTIILFLIMLLITPINADNDSKNKINRLEKKLEKLMNEFDKIYINTKKVKIISEKYKKIAIEHVNVVSRFTEQKSNCREMEDIYQKERIKALDKRVIHQQNKNVMFCYGILETMTYDFDYISNEFSKLKQSIRTLEDMSETDKASLSSIEKQRKSIKGLIRLEKSKVHLSRDEIEKIIDNQ